MMILKSSIILVSGGDSGIVLMSPNKLNKNIEAKCKNIQQIT